MQSSKISPAWFGTGHATAQRDEQRRKVSEEEPGCGFRGQASEQPQAWQPGCAVAEEA